MCLWHLLRPDLERWFLVAPEKRTIYLPNQIPACNRPFFLHNRLGYSRPADIKKSELHPETVLARTNLHVQHIPLVLLWGNHIRTGSAPDHLNHAALQKHTKRRNRVACFPVLGPPGSNHFFGLHPWAPAVVFLSVFCFDGFSAWRIQKKESAISQAKACGYRKLRG